jgi:signal peptidase I
MRAQRPRWVNICLNLLVAGGLVGWALLLRPVPLGGPATFIVIHGNSMYPTYREGDLVVAHEQGAYSVGEIVTYRVPVGQLGSGRMVIHRIAGGSAASGFVMKGDHNLNADPWHPKAADMVGSSWIAVPRVGLLLVLVRQPIVAAILAGMAAFYMLRKRFPLTTGA